MNDSTIAFRAKEQLGKFLGKVFTHFSRPKQKFMADMLYGMQASGDTQLSSIMRAINDDPGMRHAVEKRLSRNLADEGLCAAVSKAVLSEGARHVKDDTLVLVDPTEIKKEYGYRMEYISRVRDASRSSKEDSPVLVNGYHGCMAVACQPGKRKTIPLALELWSPRAPGHTSENDEVLRIIAMVMAATGGKGIIVYDRGGDRPAFYSAFVENGWDFIVRLKARSVLSWKGLHEIHELARQCTMRHRHHATFDSHGRECNVQISFGAMPVRLPMHPEKELHMVVANGFGDAPMMLLTSLPVNGSFESMWRVVEGYLSRWRIEDTIRFVKQSYGFENIRVLSYAAIRNMASIVLATTYFATTWLGRHVKREVLAEHLKALSQRLGDEPQFASYAIAAGIKRAFTRFGKWCRRIIDPEPDPAAEETMPYLPGFGELFAPDTC